MIASLLRVLLAGVFLLAGISKLLDQSGARKAFAGFGIPASLVSTLTVLVPVLEIVTGAMLLVDPWVWWGAVTATGLLILFTAAVAINLAGGRVPDCGCFGSVSASPIGGHTLVRNGVLIAMAGSTLWMAQAGSVPGLLAWFGPATDIDRVLAAIVVVLLIAVFALGWFYLQLVRQNGRLLIRLDHLEQRASLGGAAQPAPAGLPIGSSAPDFALSDLDGARVTLTGLRKGALPVTLLFISPGCQGCHELFGDVRRWRKLRETALAVISLGPAKQSRELARASGLGQLIVAKSNDVLDAFMITATPSVVMVDPDGRIASPVTTGAENVREFMTQRFGSGIPVGEPPPAVKLPDLDGRLVDIGELRGRTWAVIFWNPKCGFCTSMLEGLQRYDASRGPDSPELMFLSNGAVDELRGMNVSAPVLLDQNFQASFQFGMTGTPSAVLVDRNGRIASRLVTGADAIHELLGRAGGSR